MIGYLINLFKNLILHIITQIYYFIINMSDIITNLIISNEEKLYLIEEKKPNGYKNTYSSSLQIRN